MRKIADVVVYLLVPAAVLLLIAALAHGMSVGNGSVSSMKCFQLWADVYPHPMPQWPNAEEEVRVRFCWDETRFQVVVQSRLVDQTAKEQEIKPWHDAQPPYTVARNEKSPKAPEDWHMNEKDAPCYTTDPKQRCDTKETTLEKLRLKEEEVEKCRQGGCSGN